MHTETEQDAVIETTIILAPVALRQKWWRAAVQKLGSSELLVWAALVIVFSAFPLLHIKEATISDPDIWWHMRAGEWILQHHQVPRTDTFSWTTMGQPWVDYSWLFQVMMNWLVAHFDLVAIMWYQVVMRVAIAVALFALLRSITPGFWRAFILTAFGMTAMIQAFGPRPGIFSVLFLISELHLLLRAERTGDSRPLWAIPLLFVLWANIHIQFVYGLFVLGVFCMEPVLERLSGILSNERTWAAITNRNLWLTLSASLFATIINPYGIRLHLTAFRLARDTKLYDAIGELRAMDFRHPAHWTVLVLLIAACFVLGRMRQVRPVWAILLGWSAWMCFRSLREAWLLAIIALVVVASRSLSHPVSQTRLALQMRVAVGAMVFVTLCAGASHYQMNSKKLLLLVNGNFPTGSVSYIRRNHLQGPMLNDFSWGGFLIYAMPEIPVSMDGRTNVHSQDDVLRAISLYRGGPSWHDDPTLRDANLVICDHSWALQLLLRGDPRFHVAYEDPISVLFQAVPENPTVHGPKMLAK